MKLFITQKSYFFMHKFFLDIYENETCTILYVSEKKRGFYRKIKEILNEFGYLNFFAIIVYEIIHLFLLFRRVRFLKSEKVHDYQLNEKIKTMLSENNFDSVYSVGCPTKIDSSLQKSFGIIFYNLHGGILPQQTGRFSPLKALRNKEQQLGATLHKISDNFDAGEIIEQDSFEPIIASKLYNYLRVLKLSAKILKNHLEGKDGDNSYG